MGGNVIVAEKIRHRIQRCLDNHLHPDKLTKDELSYLDFHIYHAANAVLNAKDRKKAMAKMPSNLQDLIRARAKGLIILRNK